MGAEPKEHLDAWYVLRDNAQCGPYCFATLLQAAKLDIIARTDLIWRPGWGSWHEAGTVPGLFAAAFALLAEAPQPSAIPDAAIRRPDGATDGPCEGDEQVCPGRNYFTRHWRGALSLPVSYWLNNLLAMALVYALGLLLAVAMEGARGAGSTGIAGLLLAYTAATLAIATWQMVGVWRSASHHPARGGRLIWARVAKVMVVIGALRVLIDLNNAFVPMISEHVQIAMGDKKFGQSRFRLLRNGTELEFSGGINAGTAKEFARILDTSSDVRVLHLNSIGGRIADANLMAAEVRKRGLTTYVAEQCESACTHVFLAGRERWIRQRATIGFHRPYFPGFDEADLAPLIEQERRELLAMGLPAEFAAKAVTTPNTSMWRPTQAELLKAGIISGIVDASRFAASGQFASAATADRLSEGMLKLPLYAALKQIDPQTFERIVKQVADGYAQGATETEIIFGVRTAVSQIVGRYLPYASDAAVLESTDIAIEYMSGLKDADPESCVAMADNSRGARLRSDLTKLFPALSSRELEVNNSILESGTDGTRSVPTQRDIRPHLATLFDRLERRPALQLALINKTKLAPADYKPYCEVELAMLQEVRRMPRAESIEVLRYLFSHAAN